MTRESGRGREEAHEPDGGGARGGTRQEGVNGADVGGALSFFDVYIVVYMFISFLYHYFIIIIFQCLHHFGIIILSLFPTFISFLYHYFTSKKDPGAGRRSMHACINYQKKFILKRLNYSLLNEK